MNNHLTEFQEHLKKSKRIVALVGAGLSVSSGIPTFRGSQGLWKNFNMIDLATPDAFYIDPGLVWQFYSWRRINALKALPNKGHLALSKLSKLSGQIVDGRKLEYITITQNVDGLLSRSGHLKENLYEIHGSLFALKCTSFMCNYVARDNFKNPLTRALADTEYEYRARVKSEGRDLERQGSVKEQTTQDLPTNQQDLPTISLTISPTSQDLPISSPTNGQGSIPSSRQGSFHDLRHTESLSSFASPQFNPVKEIPESELPQCPVCRDGSLLRPDVVWFGESLPLRLIDQVDNFIELDDCVDLVLVIGTSGTVYPANSYVDRIKLRGGKVAIFNTDIDNEVVAGNVKDTWGFRGDAAELLPIALKPLIGDV